MNLNCLVLLQFIALKAIQPVGVAHASRIARNKLPFARDREACEITDSLFAGCVRIVQLQAQTDVLEFLRNFGIARTVAIVKDLDDLSWTVDPDENVLPLFIERVLNSL